MNKTAARASLVGRLFRPFGRYFQLLRGGNRATLKPFTDADNAIRDAIRFARGPGGEGVKWPVWERLFGLGKSDLGITYDSAMARKDLVRHLEAMRRKLHADIRTPGVTESAVPKALPRPRGGTSPDDVEGMVDRLWPFSRTEHYVFSPDVKSELAAVRRARLLTALAGGTAVAGGGVAAARGSGKSRGGMFKSSAASPKGRLLKIILGVTALGALGYGAKKGMEHMGGDKPADPGVSGILDMLADKARAAASSGAEWAKAHPGGAAAVAMSPLALYGLREMVRKMRGSGDGAGDAAARAESRPARMPAPMPYPYGGEAYFRMPIPAYGM